MKIVMICLLLVTNSVNFASASELSYSTFTAPSGKIFKVTVFDPAAFSKLKKVPDKYLLFDGSYSLILNNQFQLLSSGINYASIGAVTPHDSGKILGFGSCKNSGLGVTECQSLVDVFTGMNVLKFPDGNAYDNHELKIDSEGNIWVIGYPLVDCEVLQEACRNLNLSSNKTAFFDCQIAKLSSEGYLLWEWRASNFLAAESRIFRYDGEGKRSKIADPFHCNSIDFVDNSGVLVSIRNLNSILLIDYETKEVIWKLGGRYIPGVSLKLRGKEIPSHAIANAQHDARYLGNGNFGFLNNASYSKLVSEGVIFSAPTEAGVSFEARVVTRFKDPDLWNSMCTGSLTPVSAGNFLAYYGCSPSGATLFDSIGNPIAQVKIIETEQTELLFSRTPLIINGINWTPYLNYGMGYRVTLLKT